ncbi:pyruvate, water dikinase regulatory protein [Novispirillum itersonii]|uniref:pyruvate, water dikinase regulatory protein n=1 Tax=Novispirillum itersonii TaxID=189 RepID=UPI0003610506|nr:pyruvate, water dikinase regulatory protein [Novispirillum itersonii]
MPVKSLNLHLVSDSSGETVSSVARACQVQFEDVDVRQHQWWLIRTKGQALRVLDSIAATPGPVLYTVMDPAIRATLEDGFARIDVPYIPVMDPVLSTLSAVLDLPIRGKPGRQHVMDAEYFRRIEAMQFTVDHDDGQVIDGLEAADVVVFGVSRTSKTPTCMYLANRGLKAANVPVVPGIPLPERLLTLQGPLKVGLTREPRSLSDIRRNRLRMMNQSDGSAYANEETVREEVLEARRLFSRLGFPVIDVTRKSIEEAAAAILQLHADHKRRQKEDLSVLEDLSGYPT